MNSVRKEELENISDEEIAPQNRLYLITDKDGNKQSVELPITYTIRQILQETGTLPQTPFFVQIEKEISGPILLPEELDQCVGGFGVIIVYDRATTDTTALMKAWAEFFHVKNCSKCVPCREGSYRIKAMIEEEKLDYNLLHDLFFTLENTSYCALGKSIPTPFRTLLQKVIDVPTPSKEITQSHLQQGDLTLTSIEGKLKS